MNLDNLKELKASLLTAPQTMAEPLAAAQGLQSFSQHAALAQRAMAAIALGATRVGNGYHLAIRQQQQSAIVEELTKTIKQRAHNEVDVRFVGQLAKQQTAQFYRKRRRPLQIGSSISDFAAGLRSAGTLCCFVVMRSSRVLGFLTNNHVIARENQNDTYDPIVQPGTLDAGTAPIDVIGGLEKMIKLKKHAINLADAALGYVEEGIEFDPSSLGTLGKLQGINDVANLPVRAPVHKVGRTTGQTQGRVTAFDVDNVLVQYDIGTLRFDGQIEIEGVGGEPFSRAGDSGSLIVDQDLHAIGLLFAGSSVGGSNGKGLTFANPIQAVLDALQVDIEI